MYIDSIIKLKPLTKDFNFVIFGANILKRFKFVLKMVCARLSFIIKESYVIYMKKLLFGRFYFSKFNQVEGNIVQL